MELIIAAASNYAVLKQFPAALRLYDRALDIKPNDPDVMAYKASIYQAEGNLQEAARLLSGINETSSWIPFKLRSLNYNMNAISVSLSDCCKPDRLNPIILLSTRRPMIKSDLAYNQRLAGDTAGAKVTAEQARNTLEQRYRGKPDDAALCGISGSSLCSDRGEGLGPKASTARSHA